MEVTASSSVSPRAPEGAPVPAVPVLDSRDLRSVQTVLEIESSPKLFPNAQNALQPVIPWITTTYCHIERRFWRRSIFSFGVYFQLCCKL